MKLVSQLDFSIVPVVIIMVCVYCFSTASDLVEIGGGCPLSCGNGLCVPPGNCSCQPGWTGETCNQGEHASSDTYKAY